MVQVVSMGSRSFAGIALQSRSSLRPLPGPHICSRRPGRTISLGIAGSRSGVQKREDNQGNNNVGNEQHNTKLPPTLVFVLGVLVVYIVLLEPAALVGAGVAIRWNTILVA